MNRIKLLGRLMELKSGKRLIVFAVVTSLTAAVIMFFVVLFLNRYSKLKLLDQYIHEVPGIVKSREDVLEKRSKVFEEDALTRGELGSFIYFEESELSVKDRLEYVRSSVSADSVSLIDESGEVLNTTGIVLPAEAFEEALGTLSVREPQLKVYPALSDDEDSTENMAGKAMVMLPALPDNGQRLIFEFDCGTYMHVYNALSDWSNVLERMLCGLPAQAFVRIGEDDPVGYPLTGVSDKEKAEICSEATQIFDQSSRFSKLSSDSSYKLITFMNKRSVAVMMPYPEKDAKILLLIPFSGYINSGFYSAGTLAVFIAISLIIFIIYALKFCVQMHGKADEKDFRRHIGYETRPGRVLLVIVVGCFTVMLLMLESRAAIAFLGATRRMELEHEISWNENQSEMSIDLYSDIYITRVKSLAGLLENNRNYRTKSDLQSFCEMLGAEYLMLFDKNGKELISSNGYTDFSVGEPDGNLNEKYNALLLGYPSVVVGPAEDAYTKEQQMGAAVLLKKESGKPDGFLLGVFDAGALNEVLDISSIENTVNTFAVVNGNLAALISDEDGVFLAHTDAGKIGLDVKKYLSEDVYGTEYEGYTTYDDKDMYVSGDSDGVNSVLFMLPISLDVEMDMNAALAVVIMLLLIAFLYCPAACRLCISATDELTGSSGSESNLIFDDKGPLMVFVEWFAYFFTAFSVFALYSAYSMDWIDFTFVFGGMWSRGIHLFSLWAVLFFVSFTLSALSAMHRLIKDAQRRTALRTGTLLKLLDSLLNYATFIALLIGILYMFGVNTKALLASAGIVSIAVGMGSQTMIQDILAGLFLAMEDSIHLGDVVTIGESTGRVTDMGIRTTTITDEHQNTMTINNSNISDVTNMSRKKTLSELELTLARTTGMSETEKILENAIDEVSEEITELDGSLKLEGLINIKNDSFTVRLSFSCDEISREDVTRQLSELITLKVAEGMEEATAAED